MANEEKHAPSTSRTSRARRRRRSRGSVLVEMAMVLFPLVTITLGIVEIGAAWRDKSSAVQASRQGARVITSSSVANPESSDPHLADQQALLAVLAGIPTDSAGSAIQLRKVIIFDASISESQLDACKLIGESGGSTPVHVMPVDNGTKGISGRCNVYLAGNNPGNNSLDPASIGSSSNFGGGGGDWDTPFNPTSRSATLGSATEVGVYVEMYRPYITSLIPGEGMQVSGFTVMRTEPAGL